ncbi:MAG: hypothetical protein GC168_07570 [Candidatus Hydrogenedens sp.]|nr:hypothetical protein [Candidatus Hydrogenedens sp.]
MTEADRADFSSTDYDHLAPGMSYGEVASRLNGEGLLLSNNVAQLEPGFWLCSMTTQVYEWHNAEGAIIRVMFGDDGLRDKSQCGLG